MTDLDFRVVARDDLDEAFVEERLYEFNCDATGYQDYRDFKFAVEEAGQVIAAATGYTWGGSGELKLLWVHTDHRRRGLGEALLARSIAEVEAQGCQHMFVATHSFQAPAFYARHGFELIATLEGKPVGHKDHIMRLTFGTRS